MQFTSIAPSLKFSEMSQYEQAVIVVLATNAKAFRTTPLLLASAALLSMASPKPIPQPQTDKSLLDKLVKEAKEKAEKNKKKETRIVEHDIIISYFRKQGVLVPAQSTFKEILNELERNSLITCREVSNIKYYAARQEAIESLKPEINEWCIKYFKNPAFKESNDVLSQIKRPMMGPFEQLTSEMLVKAIVDSIQSKLKGYKPIDTPTNRAKLMFLYSLACSRINPTKVPSGQVYEKFFNETSFDELKAITAHALFLADMPVESQKVIGTKS